MPDDINLNDELLNQLPQFKAGFDNLRNAVNNLNREIANTTDQFTKLNNQNKETVNWGTKIKSGVKELTETYKTAADTIEIAKTAFGGWEGIASAVFTLITTYGPQVLDFLSNMFKSDKIKQAAINLQNYNDVMTAYVENVSGGLTQTRMLIKIASNINLGQKTQLEALKTLISLSPEQLKNLTLQNLKTQEGKNLVDEYTKSLKRRSLEEASLAKQTKIEQERQNLKLQRDNARQELNDYKTGKKENNKHDITATTTVGTTVTIGSYTDEEKAKDDFKKLNAEVNEKDKKLVSQINELDKNLREKLLLNKASTVTTKDKSYWENVVSVQQQQLAMLDASSKDYATKAKPIADRIKQAQKFLNLYNVNQDIKPAQHKTNVDAHAEEKVRQESVARLALITLQGHAKEIAETNQHFDQLKALHKNNKATVEQLEKERAATLNSINEKFQSEGLTKLAEYEKQLNENSKSARQQAIDQLQDDYEKQLTEIKKIQADNKTLLTSGASDVIKQQAQKAVDEAKDIIAKLTVMHQADVDKLKKGFDKEDKEKDYAQKKDKLETDITNEHDSGNWKKEFQDKQTLLDLEKNQAILAAGNQEEAVLKVKNLYKTKQAQLDKEKLAAQAESEKKYLQGVDNVAKQLSGIFGKNTIAARTAFKAHQAAAAAQVIVDTRTAIMGIWKANAGFPLIGTAKAIAETAIVAATGASNLSAILKQKPGFAQGGQYISDGRGAMLSGYSRTDNTNAYLRSGEAVVVSEAMRNPWARNLVSAVNVAFGGRDFSMPNPASGYAIGGIFTDGGNTNRYYNQPMNDAKDLANTLAYQMMNNFPPIYVDVKDINNQQNILAQTVNRVNL